MELIKVLNIFLSSVIMLFGMCTGVNHGDTVKKFEKNVGDVKIYENTLETAVAQTEIYNLISNHFSSALPEGKMQKKLIVIGYDGCRADALTLMREDSPIISLVNDGGHCVLSYCGGKNYPLLNTQLTSTAPGWCSMLTGKWANVHGVIGNGIRKSNKHLTLLTTLVENGTIDNSAFYVSWDGHFTKSNSTYIKEKQYCEEKGLPVIFNRSNSDNGTCQSVISDISQSDCSDFIFSIFEHCDHTGHGSGFEIENSQYCKAFADSEKTANSIIAAIKSRETYDTEDWMIIITSDHGGYNKSHGFFTYQERMTFIAVNKDVDFSSADTGAACLIRKR